MKRSSPRALREYLTICSTQLVRRRILPVDIVARFPAMVRHMIDLDTRVAGSSHYRKVVHHIVLSRDVLDPRDQLPALTQKVVV